MNSIGIYYVIARQGSGDVPFYFFCTKENHRERIERAVKNSGWFKDEDPDRIDIFLESIIQDAKLLNNPVSIISLEDEIKISNL